MHIYRYLELRPHPQLPVIAAIGALVFSMGASAFTVGHFSPKVGGVAPITLISEPNHEDITRAGLGLVVVNFADGSHAGFTDDALELLANKVAETDSLYYDIEKIHFDNATFQEGNERLVALRSKVAELAISEQYLDAQTQLGQALHSVEDFYAHSNWVEQNPARTDLAQLGRPGTLGTKSGTPTCTPQASQQLDGIKTGLILGVPLTTEYFASDQEYGSNSSWQLSDDVLKCIHGLGDIKNKDSIENPYPGFKGSVQYGYGINKDSSFRDFYLQARFLATRAALQFVNDVMDDLLANPDALTAKTAICGLLGQDIISQSPACQGYPLKITPANPTLVIDAQDAFRVSTVSVMDPLPKDVTYQWTLKGLGSLVSPTNAASVTYTAPTTPTTDTLSVLVSNASGKQLGKTSTSIIVKDDGVPVDPVSAQLTPAGTQSLKATLTTPILGGQGIILTYQWVVSGNAGGLLTDPVTGAKTASYLSSSATSVYTASSTAANPQQDIVTVTAFLAPMELPDSRTASGHANSTITFGNPWLGIWDGYTTSTCGSYTGPQDFDITQINATTLDFGPYTATFSGNTALVNNGEVVFTLNGNMMSGYESDSCQHGEYTRQ